MGFFDQVKQAMQMRSEAKKLQAEIEKITVEYANGGITATARGDMARSERAAKWNEAIRIEQELGACADYPSGAIFSRFSR